METVSSKALHECVKTHRLVQASDCPHIRRDEDGAAIDADSEEYVCLHPSLGDPKETGCYQECAFMWSGHCNCGEIPSG